MSYCAHRNVQKDSGNPGSMPYWKEPIYQQILASSPVLVIFMLGTNDAWQWNQDKYIEDWKAMVASLQGLASKPTVHVMIPPPLYDPEFAGMDATVINSTFPTLIPQMAGEVGIPAEKVINLFEALGGAELKQSEWFVDGCHPNDTGYNALAQAVFQNIKPSLDKGSAEVATTLVQRK